MMMMFPLYFVRRHVYWRYIFRAVLAFRQWDGSDFFPQLLTHGLVAKCHLCLQRQIVCI